MKTDWYHQHQYNGHRHQSTRPQQPQAPNPAPAIVTPRMFNVCASSLLQTECASTMVTMPVHVLILMVVKHTQQWKQCLPCIQVQTTARCTPLAAAICATCFSPCLSANARVRCVRFTLMVLRKGSGAPPEARGVQGRRRRWCRMAHAANRFFVYGGFIFLPRHQHPPPPLHPKVPATPPAAGAKAAAGGASSTAAGVAASPSRRSSTACNAMAVLGWAARFLHADLGRHYDVQKALLTADAEAFGVKGRENIAKINGELLADSEKTVRVALSFCFLGCFLVSYFLAYLEGTAEVFPVPRLYALPSLFLSLSRWHSCILILFTLMCAVPVVLYNDTHTIKGLRLTLPYCNRCGECDGDTNV